ncbi:hypothetical protein [Vibrio parahaemolyticus]|uniref:hypothetical protein n=1 Tax=Vibrio parahaemolyticus TaxID=670 RepID=UPI0025546D67|nr:hypothetical protein [Vibrio parahaemolyticus]
MIVMALLGGTEEHGEQAYQALVRELGSAQVRRLYLGYLPDPAERARRLRVETSGRWPDNIVTLFIGSGCQEELHALRSMDAFICHQYGALTDAYDQLDIQPHDLMVSESRCSPSHVMSIVEAWSECVVSKLNRRRQRAAQLKGAMA